MITKEEIKYTNPEVEFYIDNIFQFNIDNEVELNNVRIKSFKVKTK